MSVRVSTYVWKHSRHRGSALLLLLAIADHCHDDGAGAWPKVASLATKARVKERRVQQLLRVLEASGELVIDSRPHKTHLFTIPMPVKGAEDCTLADGEHDARDAENDTLRVQRPASKGAADDTLRVQRPAPEPSSNVPPNLPKEPSASEDAAPRAPIRLSPNEEDGDAGMTAVQGTPPRPITAEDSVEVGVRAVLDAYLECGGGRSEHEIFCIERDTARLLREGADPAAVVHAARMLVATGRQPWELRRVVHEARSAAGVS